ncbi:MAG: hypothetical protein IJK54_05680 [Clostridia bacterium]|nr:hypothetical protein [Clostridia bacterium]
MEESSKRIVRTIHFKPIHFILVLIACVVILLVVLIPQRLRIREAQDEYESRVELLNQTKRTYAQERENLQFMRTDSYKIQQGMIKYGWHYQEDKLIPDDSAAATAE